PEQVPVRLLPPLRPERSVAAILHLAQHPVEEQVRGEAEAPNRRQRSSEHPVRDVALREQRVQDRGAGDECGPRGVDVARVLDSNARVPERCDGEGGGDEADDEQPPDRADQASSSQRRYRTALRAVRSSTPLSISSWRTSPSWARRRKSQASATIVTIEPSSI